MGRERLVGHSPSPKSEDSSASQPGTTVNSGGRHLVTICCARMEQDLTQVCPQHPDRFDCADALIHHDADSYGIIVHDGGSSYIEISYCPWCGASLALNRP